MTEQSGLLILGFGGHARSVADIALVTGYRWLRFFDQHAKPGERFIGHEVTNHLPADIPCGWKVFPAAGDNCVRMDQLNLACNRGWSVATLIAPSASIGLGAKIHEGTFVGHQAHVGPNSLIGRGCIINTGAIVEHECEISPFCHISVNATVAGRSRIGELGFICAGATVIDKVSIGPGITIGAGATVVDSLHASGVYVGTPARLI